MKDAKDLLKSVEPELLKAFSSIPKYGSLGFTVHLNDGEPVRIEWIVSTSRKLLQKAERGQE